MHPESRNALRSQIKVIETKIKVAEASLKDFTTSYERLRKQREAYEKIVTDLKDKRIKILEDIRKEGGQVGS